MALEGSLALGERQLADETEVNGKKDRHSTGSFICLRYVGISTKTRRKTNFLKLP